MSSVGGSRKMGSSFESGECFGEGCTGVRLGDSDGEFLRHSGLGIGVI